MTHEMGRGVVTVLKIGLNKWHAFAQWFQGTVGIYHISSGCMDKIVPDKGLDAGACVTYKHRGQCGESKVKT